MDPATGRVLTGGARPLVLVGRSAEGKMNSFRGRTPVAEKPYLLASKASLGVHILYPNPGILYHARINV